MRLVYSIGLSVGSLTVCGCGGAAAQRAAPATQAPPGEMRAADAAYPQATQPQSVDQPAQGQEAAGRKEQRRDYAAPPAVAGSSEDGSTKTIWALQDDLRDAEVALSVADHDCAAACRALRSMQRAAARLCSIALTDDERMRCQSAEQRVRSARERVRSSCGQCSGGPSLSPEAPINEP